MVQSAHKERNRRFADLSLYGKNGGETLSRDKKSVVFLFISV